MLSELFFKFFTQIKSFSVVKNGQKQQQTTYFSTAGNRTPVSRVTSGDTYHYTTEETDGCLNSFLNFSLKLSHFLLLRMAKNSNKLLFLHGGESNPGLPRDRRGYLPLYYRGNRWLSELFFKFFTQIKSFSVVKNGQKQQQNYVFLHGGESNPGLPRDRRGYLPLYYRGNHTVVWDLFKIFSVKVSDILFVRYNHLWLFLSNQRKARNKPIFRCFKDGLFESV